MPRTWFQIRTLFFAPPNWRGRQLRRAVGWACLAGLTCLPAAADRVSLDDGRTLTGKFALLPGVSVDPATREEAGSTVLMCDDDLTRTFVPKRRVIDAAKGPEGRAPEQINIPQRVPDGGRRVAGIGGILAATPFDEYGRRVLTLATASGRIDVVQGITAITPRWTAVEGLTTEHPFRIDMRLATSSIPPDTLRSVIEQQIDRSDIDQRLQFVRLLIEAERYREARKELHQVAQDFPGLSVLQEQQKNLAVMEAEQLLAEIRLRQQAGQDRLVISLLENFPAASGTGELLQAVREIRDDYQSRLDRAGRVVKRLREQASNLADARDRAPAQELVNEIGQQLTFSTLGRLAVYERIDGDGQLPTEQALALGLSGWLAGVNASQRNLKIALSSARVRGLLRRYLASTEAGKRAELRRRLEDEEAFDAQTVTAVAAAMLPPIAPPAAQAEGLYEIDVPVPGSVNSGRDSIRCLVQLPPEYDALRRYPTILSLHAAWTSPLNQIEWWAGSRGAEGTRLGQAARHGVIVIAPAWAEENQLAYQYSATEHAVVLASLREASRRFAIDSDRVFLSGHSMGGDAAWDIALAHPDLWAGLIAVSATAGRYVNHYHANAQSLPLYIVGGGLDQARFSANQMDLERYLVKGYDITFVEYQGRGHEHFSDEVIRIFDWLARRSRPQTPKEINAVTLRPWDRFFWWLEIESPPQQTMVLPSDWPPPRTIRPFSLAGKISSQNRLTARCGADRVRVWLSPEFVDFNNPLTVSLGGRRLYQGDVTPNLDVLLEDLRTRCDYQHPFWAVIDSAADRL
jgi:predicted esterase